MSVRTAEEIKSLVCKAIQLRVLQLGTFARYVVLIGRADADDIELIDLQITKDCKTKNYPYLCYGYTTRRW